MYGPTRFLEQIGPKPEKRSKGSEMKDCYEARQLALELAKNNDEPPEEVTRRANVYLAFLTATAN